jgi:uncharacterized protein YfbU (UPF0304 family)
MSGDEQLEEQVRFGAQVQQFMQSDIGRYVLNLAADEVDDAVKRLKQVDPENAGEIRRLQAIIQRNEGFGLWLQEAVHAALEACNLLAGEEI